MWKSQLLQDVRSASMPTPSRSMSRRRDLGGYGLSSERRPRCWSLAGGTPLGSERDGRRKTLHAIKKCIWSSLALPRTLRRPVLARGSCFLPAAMESKDESRISRGFQRSRMRFTKATLVADLDDIVDEEDDGNSYEHRQWRKGAFGSKGRKAERQREGEVIEQPFLFFDFLREIHLTSRKPPTPASRP